MKRIVVTAAALFIAMTTAAENNCGRIVRTMRRFRGTVRAVRMLEESEQLPNAADIEPFHGTLEMGSTYRARTVRSGKDITLDGQLDLPMHHEGAIAYLNPEAIPPNASELVFEVDSLQITQVGEGAWESTFVLRVIP